MDGFCPGVKSSRRIPAMYTVRYIHSHRQPARPEHYSSRKGDSQGPRRIASHEKDTVQSSRDVRPSLSQQQSSPRPTKDHRTKADSHKESKQVVDSRRTISQRSKNDTSSSSHRRWPELKRETTSTRGVAAVMPEYGLGKNELRYPTHAQPSSFNRRPPKTVEKHRRTVRHVHFE
jgi:hypothetical protein